MGNREASAVTGIRWVQTFGSHAQIRPLSEYGLTESQFPKIIENAKKASSMKGNPITLLESELRNILQMSL